MSDLIDREAAIDTLDSGAELLRCVLDITDIVGAEREKYKWGLELIESYISDMKALPSAQQWVPCSERLPEDISPVIVTWKNTDPVSYYQHIAGKHFTGTAHYKSGKWYWYSSTTEDMLAEYGRYDSEEFDEAIECIAWMPLPKPYRIPQNETE